MTAEAISFVADNVYVSLISSVELVISPVIVRLRRRQWRQSPAMVASLDQ
jgi:hypothetical protein